MGDLFFQKPHICLFKITSVTRGTFWGMWESVSAPGTCRAYFLTRAPSVTF